MPPQDSNLEPFEKIYELTDYRSSQFFFNSTEETQKRVELCGKMYFTNFFDITGPRVGNDDKPVT